MANGGYGVLGQHTRASVAHDSADALALGRAIAMVSAFLARRLHVHLAATLSAKYGVLIKLRTLGANRLAAVRDFSTRPVAVISRTIEGDHLGYGALFALAATCDLRRVSRSRWPGGVGGLCVADLLRSVRGVVLMRNVSFLRGASFSCSTYTAGFLRGMRCVGLSLSFHNRGGVRFLVSVCRLRFRCSVVL